MIPDSSEDKTKKMESPGDSAGAPTSPPHIPDHELIRRIGGGSYGEVWLARNVMGSYRAVKVVYRRTFKNDLPYEREFKGIQKFEPISRTQRVGWLFLLRAGIGR
jgi:hypothetical protein